MKPFPYKLPLENNNKPKMKTQSKKRKQTSTQTSAVAQSSTLPRQMLPPPPPPPKAAAVASTYSDTLGHFEDVHAPTIEGCAEGNPMVARNLRRVSARLLQLASLLEYGDSRLHAASILESKRLLDEYGTALPKALATQLEAAQGWVPLGLIQQDAE